jgi:hypothetical protein
MKSLARLALTVVVVLLFAGCGARGVSSALPGGSSFSGAEAGATRQHEASSGQDLVYVTKGHSVRIYSYPQAKREKEIRGYYGETFEGECADSSGNVYVLDNSLVTSGNTFIYEYAHGGTTPIRTLFDHLIFDQSCSVDPASGYLAVTGGGAVTIWHSSKNHRKRLDLPRYFEEYACSYDERGDLFVNGDNPGNPRDFLLVELPKGSHTFVDIALPPMRTTNLGPGGIRWDGKYLAFGNRVNRIYRLAVSGTTAQVAGTVDLDEVSRVSSIWIQGNTIVGGGHIWDYPAGGKPIGSIAAGDSAGVAVSIPPTH